MKNILVRIGIPIAVWGVIMLYPVPHGLTPQAWHLFAFFIAIILAFITEPLPMGAVSLIGICLIAGSGALTINEVLGGFSASAIWLIVAAFFFARAFINTGLGRRIAFIILKMIGNNTLTVGYSFALSDLILSITTPSSTARAGGILFPIVISVSDALGSTPGPTARKVGGYLVQVIYQTEGVVCAMFMTAMAANPLMVTLAHQTAGVEISWGMWALAALVPGVAAMIVIPGLLYLIYPPELKKTPQIKEVAIKALQKMGPMTVQEWILTASFLLALILWSTSSITKLDATLVALLAVSIMLVGKVISWKDVLSETGAWDTLIWMGALIGLAGQLSTKGFIPWFAQTVSASMGHMLWIAVLGILILIYMYSHYGFASLTAHASAMYAAFLAVAVTAGAPPYLATLTLAFTANICLGITHYSGGPGPIYYSAGFVDLRTWWKLGFIISIVQLVIWIGLGALWWKVLGLW